MQQIDYLLQQLDNSIQKQRGVLPAEAIAEFEQAREAYRQIQSTAYVDPVTQLRPTKSEADEQFWLENMAVWHQYSIIEMSQVLGKSPEAIRELLAKYRIHEKELSDLRPKERVAVKPYPGGRHPATCFP